MQHASATKMWHKTYNGGAEIRVVLQRQTSNYRILFTVKLYTN